MKVIYHFLALLFINNKFRKKQKYFENTKRWRKITGDRRSTRNVFFLQYIMKLHTLMI